MNSLIEIQSLKKSITNIGKIIKSSKKKYTWEFILEDKLFILNLLISRITSKFRILINDEKIFERKMKKKLFFYEFNLQLHIITIKQRGVNFVLLIDGFLFEQKKKKKFLNLKIQIRIWY